jgi:hypothetical protein
MDEPFRAAGRGEALSYPVLYLAVVNRVSQSDEATAAQSIEA